jgi:hypothetical protein
MAASANTSKNLLQVLTTPSKLASRLDWRKVHGGTILSLNIHKDSIDLALSSHPTYGEGPFALESIPLARKSKLSDASKSALSKIVEQHKVCGFVVSWPLQNDSQRMGAACGRVLHTLEQLLPNQEKDSILSTSRPCVLWNDSSQAHKMEASDVFGRLAAYSKVPSSDKTIHIASIEQYNADEGTVATKVWNDFMRVHWPDLHQEQERRQAYAAELQQQQEKVSLLTKSLAAVSMKGRSSDQDASRYMKAAA